MARWHDAVTTLDHEIQYESVTQGFRMVGSSTKTGLAVRAFETGDKVSVDYMNSFAGEGGTKIETEYRTSLTVSKAREMYPEWYEKRIVQGLPRETWRCKREPVRVVEAQNRQRRKTAPSVLVRLLRLRLMRGSAACPTRSLNRTRYRFFRTSTAWGLRRVAVYGG